MLYMDRKIIIWAFQGCMVSNFVPWLKKVIYKNKGGGYFSQKLVTLEIFSFKLNMS